jgi:hypothetical protein
MELLMGKQARMFLIDKILESRQSCGYGSAPLNDTFRQKAT